MNDANQPAKQTQDASVTAQSSTTITAHSPQSTIAVGGKEREPVKNVAPLTTEAAPHPVPEVAVSDELKEVGVEAPKHHEPVLPTEVKRAGVTVSAPVQQVAPTKEELKLKLPMTFAEATVTEKQYKFRDAMKWIAAMVKYQWRKANPKLYK